MRPAAVDVRRAAPGATLLSLLLVVATGCDDGGPETMIGTWQLVSIDGEPLPATIIAHETDTTIMLEASLSLEDGGVFERRFRIHNWSPSGTDTLRAEDSGEWGRAGDDVWIEFYLFNDRFVDTLRHQRGALVDGGGIFGDYVYERSGA